MAEIDKDNIVANNNKTTGGCTGKGFEKGQSGNPSGRPKTPEAFKQLARDNSLDALQTVIDIMKTATAKHADRIKAADIVMNRAWGLPTQAITGGTDSEGNDKAVNIETIIRLLDSRK